MTLTLLIVDDEPLARAGLRLLVQKDPEVVAIHEARNGAEAVQAIRERRPDLVFLDVQMPGMDGFEVVKQVGAREMPAVVFVTAHDRYAVRAFDASAIDYLQKPVTADRFARALARAKGRLREDAGARMLALLESLAAPQRYPERVAVRAGDKTVFVEVGDVEWIAADENYVQLHLGNGESRHLQVTMAALERALDPARFARVHRSAIVAIARIRSVAPAAHGEHVITMTSGATVRSGRTYADRVRALLVNKF